MCKDQLEDMTLKQQKEVKEETRYALHNINGTFYLVEKFAREDSDLLWCMLETECHNFKIFVWARFQFTNFPCKK